MRVKVTMSLPPSTLFSSDQRSHLRRAGITRVELRVAWGRALQSVLRNAYPHDTFTVTVKEETDAEPPDIRFSPEDYGGRLAKRVCFEMTEKLFQTIIIAAASWAAALGTFSGLIARHRETVYDG